MPYVLGVDAGNTKTVALVAGLDGAIAGAGRAGCGDIYGVFGSLSRAESEASALEAVATAVTAALADAGLVPDAIMAAAFSMAGADWPEDIAFLRAAVRRLVGCADVLVVNDALGALRAGSDEGWGIAVVCGTGAAIGGRAPDGRVWHSSHWPGSLGAHALGRLALRAVYRAELGIDPRTSLTARVLDLTGHASVEDVLHAFTARVEAIAPDLAALAGLLLDEAEDGDAVASGIVRAHGAAIGDYALAAARRLGMENENYPLVLGGGLLRHPSPLLSESIGARVLSASPLARPMVSRLEPVAGAVMLALELAGASVDSAVLAHLAATLPAPAFFQTTGSVVGTGLAGGGCSPVHIEG